MAASESERVKRWFILTPGMYRTIKMLDDDEVSNLVIHWPGRNDSQTAEDEDEAIAKVLTNAKPGDWISVHDGIAIRLGEGLFDSVNVSDG